MIHEEMISRTYDELRQDLPATVTEEGRTLIHEAFEYAKNAHASQYRSSGEPYIRHPLAVAIIMVKEMRQEDPAVIAAALLHDVVEDTPCTMADIRNRFGEDVAFLVGAVTKPNKNQVDNFQHILSSVKRDVRILLLKLSDRLHNMRTLSGLRPQKQWKIASEKGNTIVSVDDFAPMQDRLYPVRIQILGIDRYHLLRDIIDCIVENHHLSMTGLTTQTRDHIATCDIEFSVHSANELQETILAIRSIPGVEETNVRS